MKPRSKKAPVNLTKLDMTADEKRALLERIVKGNENKVPHEGDIPHSQSQRRNHSKGK